MNKIVYQKGSIIVNDKIFKTARRTYKIDFIERIHIKRPWFLFSLPMSLGFVALVIEYRPYLYQPEIFLFTALSVALPLVTWFIGVLSVTSKSYTSDNAMTGYMSNLKTVRNAIEEVLLRTEIKLTRNDGICDSEDV